MFELEGWIKLHRELLDKAVWTSTTPEQKIIMIALLLMANHKQNQWEWNGEKFDVKQGQFITSLESIRKYCGKGISIQNIRTCLDKLKRFDFLTYKSTKRGRLITIENWGLYQLDEKNQQSNQQSTNKQLTTNKNERKKKEKQNTLSRQFEIVVDFLNEQTGKKFKSTTKKTQALIKARINEGFTIDDFKMVIKNKTDEWQNQAKMQKYLRPETLFGNKFEGYLNETQSNNNNWEEEFLKDG